MVYEQTTYPSLRTSTGERDIRFNLTRKLVCKYISLKMCLLRVCLRGNYSNVLETDRTDRQRQFNHRELTELPVLRDDAVMNVS